MGQRDDIKAALDPNFTFDPDSQLTFEEQLEVSKYKPTPIDLEDQRKDRLNTFFTEQKTVGQHTTPNTGPINFVQKLEQAKSDVQSRKKEISIALAKEKFQKKKDLLTMKTMVI